jgi:hypothetical protein
MEHDRRRALCDRERDRAIFRIASSLRSSQWQDVTVIASEAKQSRWISLAALPPRGPGH